MSYICTPTLKRMYFVITMELSLNSNCDRNVFLVRIRTLTYIHQYSTHLLWSDGVTYVPRFLQFFPPCAFIENLSLVCCLINNVYNLREPYWDNYQNQNFCFNFGHKFYALSVLF